MLVNMCRYLFQPCGGGCELIFGVAIFGDGELIMISV